MRHTVQSLIVLIAVAVLAAPVLAPSSAEAAPNYCRTWYETTNGFIYEVETYRVSETVKMFNRQRYGDQTVYKSFALTRLVVNHWGHEYEEFVAWFRDVDNDYAADINAARNGQPVRIEHCLPDEHDNVYGTGVARIKLLDHIPEPVQLPAPPSTTTPGGRG